MNFAKKKELQKRIRVVFFTIGFPVYVHAFQDSFVVTRELDHNYGEKLSL